jgi:hypothetical protein
VRGGRHSAERRLSLIPASSRCCGVHAAHHSVSPMCAVVATARGAVNSHDAPAGKEPCLKVAECAMCNLSLIRSVRLWTLCRACRALSTRRFPAGLNADHPNVSLQLSLPLSLPLSPPLSPPLAPSTHPLWTLSRSSPTHKQVNESMIKNQKQLQAKLKDHTEAAAAAADASKEQIKVHASPTSQHDTRE